MNYLYELLRVDVMIGCLFNSFARLCSVVAMSFLFFTRRLFDLHEARSHAERLRDEFAPRALFIYLYILYSCPPLWLLWFIVTLFACTSWSVRSTLSLTASLKRQASPYLQN
jgi:hypothetical protein